MNKSANVPRVEIYLNEQSLFCISDVSDLNELPFTFFELSMAEVSEYGEDEFIKLLGTQVLVTLKSMYRQSFKQWGMLKEPQEERAISVTDAETDYFVAVDLVHQGLSGKTKQYNAAIEYLLHKAATEYEDARYYLEKTWPVLRDRIER